MRCAASNTNFLAEGDPTIKLRRFPNATTYQSYGSPKVGYTDLGNCEKVNACPPGEDMPLKGEVCLALESHKLCQCPRQKKGDGVQ